MSDPQEEKSWQERVFDRLKTNYRFVVMNDDTFEEVNTYHSSLGKLLSIGVFAALIISFLTALFFLFSPITTLVGNLVERTGSKTSVIQNKIENLESELKAQQVLQENIRSVLTGQPDTMGTGHQHQSTEVVSNELEEVERVPEDEALRQELAADQTENTPITDINLPESEPPLGQRFFSPPVTGELSKVFEPASKHYGVDIIAPKNTPIKSTLDGYVISADWNLETGNTICIQHKGDVITFYKHNSALLKKVGDIVKAGEAIAIIGDTGDHSTGPHLHFELWHKGIPVDPGDYVNFY